MERKLKKDLHTHTIYSRGNGRYGHHASGTMAENVESAFQKGLKTIGISDHGPSHKIFGINPDDWNDILREKNRLNEEYSPKGLKVLLGMESNLVGWNGEIDVPSQWEKSLDYILMGYHYGVMPFDKSTGVEMFIMNPLAKFFKVGSLRTIERNTLAYIRAVEKNNIWGITHPGDKIEIDVFELAKVCKKHGTKLEINSCHKKLTTDDLLSLKANFNDYFIGSDAHHPMRVGMVDNAIDICNEAGIDIDKLWNFGD